MVRLNVVDVEDLGVVEDDNDVVDILILDQTGRTVFCMECNGIGYSCSTSG